MTLPTIADLERMTDAEINQQISAILVKYRDAGCRREDLAGSLTAAEREFLEDALIMKVWRDDGSGITFGKFSERSE